MNLTGVRENPNRCDRDWGASPFLDEVVHLVLAQAGKHFAELADAALLIGGRLLVILFEQVSVVAPSFWAIVSLVALYATLPATFLCWVTVFLSVALRVDLVDVHVHVVWVPRTARRSTT